MWSFGSNHPQIMPVGQGTRPKARACSLGEPSGLRPSGWVPWVATLGGTTKSDPDPNRGLYSLNTECVVFLGPEHARHLGHTMENFILECAFIGLKDGIEQQLPCSEYGNITPTLIPNYMNCFTITNAPVEDILPYGIAVTLYLDNFPENIYETYSGNGEMDSPGVQVYVHPHNTIHNVWEGFRAQSGHITTVVPHYSIRERLSEPHGLCKAKEEGKNEDIWNYERQFSYSKIGCYESCIQEALKENCGCIAHDLSSIGQNSYNQIGDVTGCSSVKQGFQRFINMSWCTYNVGMEVIMKCYEVDTCKDECTNIWQTLQLDAVLWPIKSKQLSFYNKLIKGRHFAPKFDVYDEILSLIESGNKTEASVLLQNVNLIENNFAKFNFIPSAFHIVKFEDIPKTKLVDVISNLGGTLNLYSGITLLVIIEIIELTWKIFTGTVNYGNQQTQPSS